MAELDLDDIQGLILRGYKMPTARHLVLRIDDRDGFKAVLRGLVTEEPGSGPSITVATDWNEKPPIGEKPAHCVNIGLTFEGLKALGVPGDSLESFPDEFVEGAVARAARVGDTGPSAPENWRGALASPAVHVLLSVSAHDQEELDAVTAELHALIADRRAATELSCHDGRGLKGDVAHFGYKDGFSQPTIEGAPMAGLVDPLPPVPPGDFLLGYPSQHAGSLYPVPTPEELGRNGSYAAFRILSQDVAGFERFLRESAQAKGLSEEMLAAKLCGRWRNGVPLTMSPETDSPDPPISPDQLNNFDYATSEGGNGYDDRQGYWCPVGSHIRRAHPRSHRVAGGGGHRHRLVRRGLPYGPEYDPGNPDDDHERGLLGLFIGASLADQFEFIMKEWVNDGTFAARLGRTKDPLLGRNDPRDSKFVMPTEDGPVEVTGFSQFVTTRGGAYCFLPSITALSYMTEL